MYLALALRSNVRFSNLVAYDPAERAEVRRRFNQLKNYGCNPEEISGYFDSWLEHPTPQPEQQAQTLAGFEPGTYTRSMSLSSDFKREAPTLLTSAIGMAEEGRGLPVLGNAAAEQGHSLTCCNLVL